MRYFIIIFFTAITLASCAHQVRIQDSGIKTPEKFRNQKHAADITLSEKYWENFQDPQLNRLVEQGLQNNSDLKAAAYRIQRDFALARIKFAQLFPELTGNPSYERLRYSLNTGQPIGQFNIPRDQNLFTLPLDFSYELDLWGRVRNQYKAAKAQAKGTYYAYLDTQLLLSAEIIKTYFGLQYNQFKVQALQQILHARQDQELLSRSRLGAGLASKGDYLRSANQELAINSELALAEAERFKLLSSLAVLLGEHPSTFTLEVPPLSLHSAPLLLPNLLPSEWIRRRPDILSAEENILAANAMTKSALAEFFPKFTFNVRFGVQSLSASNLLSQGSTFFSLGPALSIPIFDMGARLANYRARKSEAYIALENYKKTVLSAFKDVEDKLAEFNDAETEFKNYHRMAEATEQIERLENEKWKVGLLAKGQALEANIEAQNIKMQAAAKKLSFMDQTVELFRSFGGGLNEGLLQVKEAKK